MVDDKQYLIEDLRIICELLWRSLVRYGVNDPEYERLLRVYSEILASYEAIFKANNLSYQKGGVTEFLNSVSNKRL